MHLKCAKRYSGLRELEERASKLRPASSEEEEEEKKSDSDAGSEGGDQSGEVSLDESQPELSQVDEPLPDEPEPSEKSNGSKADDSQAEDSSSSSSDEESSGFFGTKKEYFTATTVLSDRHKWLCKFFDYLALPEAGCKKLEGQLQHAS